MFTVVIPTHNRKSLVARAIDSVHATACSAVEIIVVDDASGDGTAEFIANRYPAVQMLRMPTNNGPSAARNAGIGAATMDWVLMLDDDDLLNPGALKVIQEKLRETPDLEKYPVIQFACSNAKLAEPFIVAGVQDYVSGRLQGDFAPLIQTRIFREKQVHYPTFRIGGESLLWFEIAQKWGIPSYSDCVIQVTRDAPSNLCSTQSQLRRPREYAELQEQMIARFGEALFDISPDYYRKKVLGGIIYRLLAGDTQLARTATDSSSILKTEERLALRLLSLMPQQMIRMAFKAFRRAGG